MNQKNKDIIINLINNACHKMQEYLSKLPSDKNISVKLIQTDLMYARDYFNLAIAITENTPIIFVVKGPDVSFSPYDKTVLAVTPNSVSLQGDDVLDYIIATNLIVENWNSIQESFEEKINYANLSDTYIIKGFAKELMAIKNFTEE